MPSVDAVGHQPGTNLWEITRPPRLIVESSDHERPIPHLPSRTYLMLKRSFDVVAATLLLVALAPFLVVLALIVKRSSPGCVLFVQTRVGKDMKPFRCLKFRTMVDNAEHILLENPQLRDAMAVTWKLREDPRITRVGGILRKTSLDELPQLWNVLRGEMSLIGPRPYLPRELEGEFGRHAHRITAVRPGITGLWQVSGRSHLIPAQRIALDETYVLNACLRADAHILARTVRMVLISNYGAF